MTASSNAAKAAKLAAKYGPHVAAAVKMAGPAVKESVETQRKRLESRHSAYDKAGTLADGSVLRQRDGDDVVWVVFTGDEPVAVYPQAATPIAELVRSADLSKRVTPAEHEAAKVRSRAGQAARNAAGRVKPGGRKGGSDRELEK